MDNLPSDRRRARECAIQFLYQSERDKTYYFQESSFDEFCGNFYPANGAKDYALALVKGTFDKQVEIDRIISEAASNWSLARFGSTDRCVLRVAVCELLSGEVPFKVVLNEAIDLARIYGTENSGKFVNGILDRIVKDQGIK